MSGIDEKQAENESSCYLLEDVRLRPRICNIKEVRNESIKWMWTFTWKAVAVWTIEAQAIECLVEFCGALTSRVAS